MITFHKLLHNCQVDRKLLFSCKVVTHEIVLVKKKKKDLLDCIASLDTDITQNSFEAEKKKYLLKRIHKKLKLKLTKANVFWKSKTEKEKPVSAHDVALGKLESGLKVLEYIFYFAF